MTQPLVSIIVPIYNAEQYIHRCVDSLLAQTYPNLEVILVDDGSPDRCGAICDEYAAKDSRVKVFHQENGGVSRARNKGIDFSTGEYIAFVDADDEVLQTYIDQLMEGFATPNENVTNTDLVVGGYVTRKDLSKGKAFTLKLNPTAYSLAGGVKKLTDYFNEHIHNFYAGVPWGKIYKAGIIKKNALRFDPNIRLSEDHIFNLQYLKYCNTVYLMSSVGYIYTECDIPIEKKYSIKVEEHRYTFLQYSLATEELNKTWQSTLNCDRLIRKNIGIFYPLSKVIKDEATYFSLYKEFFNETGYYQDYHCSPIFRCIHEAKSDIKKLKFLSAIKLLYWVRRNHGDIVSTLSFSGLDRHVSYLCRK